MRYDLFISHSSADAETARALVTDFENRNITCWMAPRDIPMGSSYHEEIVAAIENSRAVLLLFSGAANKSEHVLREVELAAQGKKPIYPLRIDVSEPAGGLKYMLANKQWVERKALGNRLVDTIEQLLAGARPPRAEEKVERPPTDPPKEPARISPVLIGAAAAACLVLAAVAVALQAGWFGKATTGTAQVAPQPKPVPAAPEPQVGVIAPVQPPPAAPAVSPPAASETKAPDPPAPAQPPAAPPVQEASRPVEPVSLPTPGAADPDILNHAPDLGQAVPGKTFFRECDMCPVMAVIPAGSNRIGSPGHESGRSQNEGPQQDIAIRPALAVARSEIAFEEWLACVAEGGCNAHRPGDFDFGYGKQPAINVSWNDAQAYVEWLSRKTKAEYRLLSEAEWEYAARGCARVCESLPFWFGIEISRDRANYDSRLAYLGSPRATPRRRTVPIDAGEPNPFGLLHVHGNVREWVADCWNESLAGIARDAAPRTTGDCSRRVVRGGSWGDEPKEVRSAKRFWQGSNERSEYIGFRVARALKL